MYHLYILQQQHTVLHLVAYFCDPLKDALLRIMRAIKFRGSRRYEGSGRAQFHVQVGARARCDAMIRWCDASSG
jgi:hypothetical protein